MFHVIEVQCLSRTIELIRALTFCYVSKPKLRPETYARKITSCPTYDKRGNKVYKSLIGGTFQIGTTFEVSESSDTDGWRGFVGC